MKKEVPVPKSTAKPNQIPPLLLYGEESGLATEEIVDLEELAEYYNPTMQISNLKLYCKGATWDIRSTGNKSEREDRMRTD